MNKEQLQQFLSEFFNECQEISKRKNSDYAAGDDPFRNFRRHGVLGFLVRMGDKLSRLDSFADKGSLEVKDESVEDTLMDLANYSALLAAFIRSKREPASLP